MDVTSKLECLGESARYDLCGNCGGTGENRVRGPLDRWIYPAVLPDGKRVRLLKVLQTNACRNDCRYCATRCSRDIRRTSFRPEELAAAFDAMRRAGKVSGLFLSSGVVRSADVTMERMLATVELLRRRYGFRGYVHLKVLPGASDAAIEAAARLADRISVNLEAPSASWLRRIAPDKDFAAELLSRLRLASALAARPDVRARSTTTQYVVGAAGESDAEIINRTAQLYAADGLYRAYYSAYQPPDDAGAGGAVPVLREHRLYQADFLLRKYRFDPADIVFDANGNLSLEVDPKHAWARRHPERFPVDVNHAPREELLRVPGIGPTAAKRILACRGRQKLRAVRDLTALGAVGRRAASYITFGCGMPRPVAMRQLLWYTS